MAKRIVAERQRADLLIHLSLVEDECPELKPLLEAIRGRSADNVKHEIRKVAGCLDGSLMQKMEKRRAEERKLRQELAEIKLRLRDVHGYTRHEPGLWRYFKWRIFGVKFWFSREDDFQWLE